MVVLGLIFAILSQSPEAANGDKVGLVRIAPALRVDRDNGLVWIDAEVVQREVALELLLCPKGMREHESVLAADVNPRDVHLALLLAGGLPGRPVQSEPFSPPVGQRIKVWVEVGDPKNPAAERRLIDARQWLRYEGSKKPPNADFVFAGSSMMRTPGSDRVVYLADEGYIICVANFPHAILDVSVRSTDKEAQGLSFVPFTDRIPEKGTKVRVVLEPVVD